MAIKGLMLEHRTNERPLEGASVKLLIPALPSSNNAGAAPLQDLRREFREICDANQFTQNFSLCTKKIRIQVFVYEQTYLVPDTRYSSFVYSML